VPIPISVVVCTRNRCDSLRRCVEALGSTITKHEWELVIVDNGSDDGTSSLLASLPTRFRNVQITFEPKRGLAAARNAGVRKACGSIIAFTDDDCYVFPDYIDAMISAFENRKIGFVGGRVLLYDPSDLRITIQEKEDYCVLQPRTFFAPGTVHGANMAFRRTVLDCIGGFDEKLGAGTSIGSGEDTDALASAIWAGIAGAYDPRPTVYHHHKRKTENEARALGKVYNRGRGAYYAKYIIRNDTRSDYLRNWTRSVRRGASSGGIIDRLAAIRQAFRELGGAIHYVAVRTFG
jgi:glycosyltransferase involved in cell wall biosynthesis